MLEVGLLGQFSLQREGERLGIPSRPAQSLFAYLVLNPSVRHRRERLAGMFWPDSLESGARNNLRQALWLIRSSIEDEKHQYITSDRLHVGFDPEAEVWLDIEALIDREPNKLDEAFRGALSEQAIGHPLLTIELLRELEGRGDLVQDSKGRWT
ncbi:MAG: hypothetical protein BMS9Abin28_0037 [Anaerolineae bacterium]|nr:MAG: hypothetical protein BMS9Abin28_0037 [Anaerolineae bacterium]